MRTWCIGAAAAAVLCLAGTVHADTQLYSFETGTDGFLPNGGGVTVSQDTIGATDGTHSMKVALVSGAFFSGALTGTIPAALGNPPGVDAVKFDMTIDQGDAFTGAFDDVGITIFGYSPATMAYGYQAQFAPYVAVDGKTPGTYLDQEIALTGATNPLTFDTNQSFNDIFGPGPNQLIPTGFEFFISKSNDAPTTVYFDNVRVVSSVPEPATLGLFGLGAVVIGVLGRRRRNR